MIIFQVKNKKFNTYPSIFHHPGKIGDGNKILGIIQLKKLFFASICEKENGCFIDHKEKISFKIPTPSSSISAVANKLTVVFVSNLKEIGSGPRSLDYFGVPYRIIGSQVEQWSNELKLKLLNDELSSIKTKYFMLLDSNDTFIVNDFNRAMKIFETLFDCDILLNAGQNLWPSWPDEMREHQLFCDRIGERVKSNHKYVNTGAFIAKTEFYKEIMKTFDIDKSPLPGSDQAAFYPLYKQYYPKIQLDHTCKIFQCEFDEELEIESSILPWYRKHLVHTKSLAYPLFKKYASWHRNKKKLS
ncbi:glycosyltransferase domain-containing protein [Chamaesiphon sp.]|uniref:glycosyltransferase domain-containing protein n=1 Tax=Chamaesiphon sp. TaxID=2814140 RepID=UPI003594142B